MTSRVVGTFAADGSSSEITSSGRPLLFDAAGATFGAGTVTVQMKNAADVFVAVPAAIIATLSAAGILTAADFPAQVTLRLNLAGATAPSIPFILQA